MATVKKVPVKKNVPKKPVLKNRSKEKKTSGNKNGAHVHDWEGFFQGNYAGAQQQTFKCKLCGEETSVDPKSIKK